MTRKPGSSFATFEIVSTLSQHPAATLFVARSHLDEAGALRELIILEEDFEFVDELAFHTAVLPRWRTVSSIGDARLPRFHGGAVPGMREPIAFLFEHVPSIGVDALAARAADVGGLALPLVVALAHDLVGALASLHARDLVHAELTPAACAAVLAAADDDAAERQPVGRIVTTSLERITYYTNVAGIPHLLGYCAPEVLQEEHVGAAADVFSVATILYELASGKRAFAERGSEERAYDEIVRGPPPLSRARAGLPDALCNAVDDAFGMEPTTRTTLDELRAALDGVEPNWTAAQVQAELRALFPDGAR